MNNNMEMKKPIFQNNNFLKSIGFDKEQFLKDFYNEDAIENFENNYSSNKAFFIYYGNLKNEEKEIIMTLASFQHYIMLKRDSRKKLIQQCNIFLESLMCKRNLQLKRLVELEIAKFKFASSFNMVIVCIQSLNSFYSGYYHRISKIERAVKISEALHYLSIYDKVPYMTLEEANKYAIDNILESGRKVIYGRLKAYIK